MGGVIGTNWVFELGWTGLGLGLGGFGTKGLGTGLWDRTIHLESFEV